MISWRETVAGPCELLWAWLVYLSTPVGNGPWKGSLLAAPMGENASRLRSSSRPSRVGLMSCFVIEERLCGVDSTCARPVARWGLYATGTTQAARCYPNPRTEAGASIACWCTVCCIRPVMCCVCTDQLESVLQPRPSLFSCRRFIWSPSRTITSDKQPPALSVSGTPAHYLSAMRSTAGLFSQPLSHISARDNPQQPSNHGSSTTQSQCPRELVPRQRDPEGGRWCWTTLSRKLNIRIGLPASSLGTGASHAVHVAARDPNPTTAQRELCTKGQRPLLCI